jgi:tRNA1Val (adenine37-N6)-methyltransferase
MANDYFRFKQFTVNQRHCAMKVTTDACLFGAWAAFSMADDRVSMADDRYAMTENPENLFSYDQRPSVIELLTPILDIGTGTGLLALMLAQKTGAAIDAVEIDPAAAAEAAQNMAASPWADRLRVIVGDITQLHLGKQYPLIVSNPPFFENQLASPDAGRQKALHATELPLTALFAAVGRYLHPAGNALLLLPAYRHAELLALAAEHGLSIQHIVWVRQTPAHQPFRIMVRLGHSGHPPIEEQLIIKENPQQYSPAFVGLLQDYYLYL